MEKARKILILTADAGFGHRSAALAVKAALEERYGPRVSVALENPLDDKRAPAFLRDSQQDYDRIVRAAPELYKLGYEVSDEALPSAIMESALGVLLLEAIRGLIKQHHPDVILVTYPMYHAALAAYTASPRHDVPFYTVVTDLVSVHRMWFNNRAAGCLVPTTIVRDLAIENGILEEKITLTGIPVRPEIARPPADQAALRASLGLHPDLPTILAVGSRRVQSLLSAARVLNHFGLPVQLIAVAGKDPELYASLQQMEWHIPVKLLEFTDDMPALMQAADAIICKAGGLIVTESLACGLPMMLVDVIPGQETGNAEYVVQNGAGTLVDEPLEMLETIADWLRDGGRLLREKAENARRLGRPQAAFETAEILFNAAEAYNRRRRERSTRPRRPIATLLNERKEHRD